MSPVAPLGWPDWQKQTQWDSPVLYQFPAGVYNAQQLSPAIETDKYQSICVFGYFTAGQVWMKHGWAEDQALTIGGGSRNYIIDPVTFGQSKVDARLVSRGPWYQLALQPIGASFRALTPITVFATNRGYPYELSPDFATVIDVQQQNVNAGATFSAYNSSLAVGRAHLWSLLGNAGPGYTTLSKVHQDGTYHIIAQQFADSHGEVNLDVELPPNTLKLDITNQGAGAANAWAALTVETS